MAGQRVGFGSIDVVGIKRREERKRRGAGATFAALVATVHFSLPHAVAEPMPARRELIS